MSIKYNFNKLHYKKDEKYMDKEKCNVCIYSKYSDEHISSICKNCYQIEAVGDGSNIHFIKKMAYPETCGKCDYAKHSNESTYCDASKFFDKDNQSITFKYKCIRKNYLNKNTPKWCPLKEE